MEKREMWIICYMKVHGVDTLAKLLVATNADPGVAVKVRPGLGKEYWAFPSLPSGTLVSADFTGAPIVNSDVSVNNANIMAIAVTPEDVLTFA